MVSNRRKLGILIIALFLAATSHALPSSSAPSPVEIRNTLGEKVEKAANVLGEIPGTDLKDEVVMMGAHLDSWHASPNASDDASGCAVALDAAGLPGFQFIQDRIAGTAGHTNLDFLDTLSAEDLMKNAVVMAAFVYQVAMCDTRIPRKLLK